MSLLSEKIAISKEPITLGSLWNCAWNEQYAIAVWRLPKQKNLHFMVDLSGKPHPQKIDFEETASGFCLSPFINSEGKETLFLKNDLYFEIDPTNYCLKGDEFSISEKMFIEKLNLLEKEKNQIPRNQNSSKEDLNTEKETYMQLVTKAIDTISNNFFEKVVLSRCREMECEGSLDIADALIKLCEKYANAFVSAVYLPQTNEIWLGASPELLVSLDEEGIFKTMSLAGTQLAFEKDGSKIDPSSARWSQKEIEEQAFVSRYIIECFKKVRVREYIEIGPKTVEAGNLLHLQTTFSVDTKAIEFNQFATVLLDLLHPTSAVCGMPKATSMEFILKNENYDREFYSGFLGPINIKNSSAIFVNLRSLKIKGNKAYLYAGAGITEDSDPEREWNETEIKLETLLNVIHD